MSISDIRDDLSVDNGGALISPAFIVSVPPAVLPAFSSPF